MTLRAFAAVAAALLVSACWQHPGSLYTDAKPVQPLQVGPYTQTTRTDALGSEYELQADGYGYRLVPVVDIFAGQTSEEVDAFTLYPLPGAPIPGVYVAETIQLTCNAFGGECKDVPDNGPHYYSLVVVQADGITETRPDCNQTSALAAIYGAFDADKKTCIFKDRATLEAALLKLGTVMAPTHLYKRHQ